MVGVIYQDHNAHFVKDWGWWLWLRDSAFVSWCKINSYYDEPFLC